MERKIFAFEVTRKGENGGRITVSTSELDRQHDRVFPAGAKLDGYRANPVVQWGHNYSEAWATVGKTTNIAVEADRLVADFELRPAANEADPQNIVRLLWDGGWIRAASIGFNPLKWVENENGGRDFVEWELLEWSLVPVPANASALADVAKALTETSNLPAQAVTDSQDATQGEGSERREPEATAATVAADADELTPEDEERLVGTLGELLDELLEDSR